MLSSDRVIVKSSTFLESILKVSFFGTIIQIMKKFRLLTPLMLICLPPSLPRTLPSVLSLNRQVVKARIKNRNSIKHPDYMQQICSDETEIPSQKHLEQVAGQLLIAGYDPLSNVFYSTILFLLKEPEVLRLLTQEVRGAFTDYDEINSTSLLPLKYLFAVLQESLRIHTNASFGLPRSSPGALVDGQYIPQGVSSMAFQLTSAICNSR